MGPFDSLVTSGVAERGVSHDPLYGFEFSTTSGPANGPLVGGPPAAPPCRQWCRFGRARMAREAESLPCQIRSASDSPQVPPASPTWATSAPRSSTGCSRAGPAARSSSASKTPTSRARSKERSRLSWRRCGGWAWTGTRAPTLAETTAPTSSRSAWTCTAARPTICWPPAAPTTATAGRTGWPSCGASKASAKSASATTAVAATRRPGRERRPEEGRPSSGSPCPPRGQPRSVT